MSSVASALAPPLPPVTPIDLELLARLPTLSWRARYLVDSLMQGRHRSPTKGSSVEFAEYRAYQLGDDLRRIDWRLFGRTERLHLRQYEEDVQVQAQLVLDLSASMSYSGDATRWTKLDYARTILAALATLLQREQDAAGLALIGAELLDYTKARAAKGHWQTLIRKLDGVTGGTATQLGSSLQELARLLPKRSVVVIASDFYENEESLLAAVRRLRYDRHEVIGVHVLDPVEVDFNLETAGIFIDLESSAQLTLHSAAVREGYLKKFRAFLQRTEEIFRDHGGDYVFLRTDRDPLAALTAYLAWREKVL